MTQPDLVSKLREAIAKVKPLMEKATPRPWSTNSQFIPQASAKILVGSDRRSIAYVGMNPQSKEWETYAQDITNTLLIIAAVNAMDELESLIGLEGQAATCDHKRKAFYLGPDGSEFCVCGFKKFGPRSTVEKQPPSTPIVPGTAGLSEIGIVKAILSAHQTAYAKFHNTEGRNVIESDGMAIGYASVELAKLLTGREAKIRKDVLEEAARVADSYGDQCAGGSGREVVPSGPNKGQFYGAGYYNVATAIRALAERPAPAGEVKEKS